MNNIYFQILFVLLIISINYSNCEDKKNRHKRQILTNRLALIQMMKSGVIPVNSASSFFSPVTFPTNYLIQPQSGMMFQFQSGQPSVIAASQVSKVQPLDNKSTVNSTPKPSTPTTTVSTSSIPTQFERFRRKFISPLVAPKDKFPDYCKKKLFRSLPVECRSRLEGFNFNF